MKDALVIDTTLAFKNSSLEFILSPLTDKNSLEIILEKVKDLPLDKFVLVPEASSPALSTIKDLCEGCQVLPYGVKAEVRNTADLLKGLHELVKEKEIENIILLYADSPLIDRVMLERLYKLHKESLSEYTFGDNFSEGLVPEVMSREFLEKITQYEYKKPDLLSRKVFDCIHADINRFFIDLEIAEYDLSMMRIELVASSRRNMALLRNVLEFVDVKDDYRKIYKALQQNPGILFIFPRYIEVEITSRDNMNCLFCPRSKLKRENLNMEPGLYMKIIKELTEEYDDIIVDWALMGEPLLHPDFLKLADWTLDQKGVFNLIIETNGLAFDRSVTEKLSAYPVEKLTLVFGIDSLKEETYSQIRTTEKKDALSQVKQNILDFMAFDPKNKLRTFIQILKMKQNNLELEEFYRFWQNQGVNVIIQKYNSYLGLLEDRSVVDLTPLDRIPCWHLQRDLEIFSNGDVPVCKQDIKGDILLGNLNKESLRSIWEKQKKYFLFNFREDYTAFPLCRDCDEWYTYNF